MQDKFDDMSNNLVGKIDEMGYFLDNLRRPNWWHWKKLKLNDEWNW